MTTPPKPEGKYPRVWIAKDHFREDGTLYQEYIRVYDFKPSVAQNGWHEMLTKDESEALVKEAVAKAKAEAWDSALEYCAEFITRPADCSPDAIVAAAWFRAKKASRQ